MLQSATSHRAPPTAEHGELYIQADAGAVVEAVGGENPILAFIGLWINVCDSTEFSPGTGIA